MTNPRNTSRSVTETTKNPETGQENTWKADNKLRGTPAKLPQRCKWLAAVVASDFDPTAKAVATALWLHADPEGVAFPSIGTLATESHTSSRTVSRALAVLEMRGFLASTRPDATTRPRISKAVKRQTRWLPNVYHLAFHGALAMPPVAPLRHDTRGMPKTSKTCQAASLRHATAVANEQSIEPSIQERAADAAFVGSHIDGGGGSTNAKLAAMAEGGLQPNERIHKLAENPHLTVDAIRAEVQTGARNGILVNKLEVVIAEAAEVDLVRKRDAEARERQAEQWAARDRERLDLERTRVAARAVIDRHPADEVDEAFQEHLETIDMPMARRNTVLQNCTTYVAAILEAKAANRNGRNGKAKTPEPVGAMT